MQKKDIFRPPPPSVLFLLCGSVTQRKNPLLSLKLDAIYERTLIKQVQYFLLNREQ